MLIMRTFWVQAGCMFAQQGLLKLGAHSSGINWLYVQSAEAADAHDAHSLGINWLHVHPAGAADAHDARCLGLN